MTGYLRRRFQAEYGDAGHGFFMPARPWRRYRHQDLTFENPGSSRLRWKRSYVQPGPSPEDTDGLYGLAGMRVTADSRHQWSRVRTSRRGPYGNRASQFELWYHQNPNGGDLVLKMDRGRNQRIRTQGETGLGVFALDLEDRSHQMSLKPRGNGPVDLFGAVFERDHPGVVIDTLGINGARAISILHWNEALWKELLVRRDPALVVLAYGTNESGDEDEPMSVYEQNLREVIRKVRRAAPAASCLLFGPTDRPVVHRNSRRDPRPSFTRRVRTDAIVETQRRVAADMDCGFFDAVAATGGQWSIINWAHMEPRLAYPDYVHLTSRGYRVLADHFYNALVEGLTE
jgi:lysophospholipase L1-like esterase